MPRAAGQIDRQKNEAILDAAAKVLSERGMAAPIETIARLAGVSKQTIYNHYGNKAELVRALIARRAANVTEPLNPEAASHDLHGALSVFALQMLRPAISPESLSMMRVMILAGEEVSELAAGVYEVGPQAALERTAAFIRAAADAGRLAVDDATEAAEFFIGMVVGHRQLRLLLRIPPPIRPDEALRIASEAAFRFIRAYEPRPA